MQYDIQKCEVEILVDNNEDFPAPGDTFMGLHVDRVSIAKFNSHELQVTLVCSGEAVWENPDASDY